MSEDSATEITVIIEGEPRESFVVRGEMILGRQGAGEPGPLCVFDAGGTDKLIVASYDVRKVSRRFAVISVGSDGLINVKNVHSTQKLQLLSGEVIQPGKTLQIYDGQTLLVTDAIHIMLGGAATAIDSGYRSLKHLPPTPTIHRTSEIPSELELTLHNVAQSSKENQETKIIDLLKLALSVVNRATGSDAFYRSAARATGRIAGLDRAEVLLWEDQRWNPKGTWSRFEMDAKSCEPSSTLLMRVREQKRTQLHESEAGTSNVQSLVGITRAVASPILDEGRNVIGVLYGDRHSSTRHESISDAEAMLVELLAGTVATAFARESEQRARQQLSQFFSSRVTEELQRQPNLLAGQDVMVTVMFCDIRRFSAESEHLGPRQTLEWINDVFTDLGACILRNDGVLVDFMGDELLAMFGAPGDQPDHAQRACAAAVAMLKTREELRRRWAGKLQQELGFGIGLNTGIARVGNTGSRVRFKYAPLGHHVNLGSRIQGMSKFFGVPAIASEATVSAIKDPPKTRRLGTTKVVGIESPVELHELPCEPTETWQTLRDRYEAALDAFLRGDYPEAQEALKQLESEFPEDRPTKLLLDRTRKSMENSDNRGSVVWQPTSK